VLQVNDLIGDDRPMEALELKWADFLGVDEIWHRGIDPLADQDLSRRGLGT